MTKKLLLYALLIAWTGLFVSCSEDSETPEEPLSETRSFFMGFTAFPYDISTTAVDETLQNVKTDGDVLLNHFDFGIPWDEVRDDLPYPNEVQNAINIAKEATSTHKVIVTTTTTDQSRENLALYWNDAGTHQPLPAFWQGRAFDNPEVISTFIKYCRSLIDEIQPDYFGYGIEVNAAFRKDDAAFAQYLTLAENVYTTLKSAYPDLPIFLTVQDQSFNNSKAELLETTEMLLEHSDYIAMSSYPFFFYEDLTRDANPDLFADDWLQDFRNLDPSKPFAVSETGFSAEDLVIQNLGINAQSSEAWQAAYVEKLMNHLNDLDAEFVAWFVYRDYDLLYDKTPSPPDILKIWRDNGLLDGQGNARPSHAAWREWLARDKE